MRSDVLDASPNELDVLREEAERELRAILGDRAVDLHPLLLDGAASSVAGVRLLASSDAPGIRLRPWIRSAVGVLKRLDVQRADRRRLLLGRRH